MLLLRRRRPGETPGDDTWLRVERYGPAQVNAVFREHPSWLLGTLEVGAGMYNAETLLVTADPGQDTPARLAAKLHAATRAALDSESGYAAPTTRGEAAAPPVRQEHTASVARVGEPQRFDGYLKWDGAQFQQTQAGRLVTLDVPASQRAEMQALLGLRDVTVALLQAEGASRDTTAQITSLRQDLSHRYEAYLDTTGRVDLPLIAELLGTAVEQAAAQLGERVYLDPAAERLVPAAEYLSGNVRAKLDAALVGAEDNPALQVNVRALRAVLPADLGPEEITPALGAVWIPDADVQTFLGQLLGDPTVTVTHGSGSAWSVTGEKHTVAATNTWGTAWMNALDLAQHLLQQQPTIIHDALDRPDGSTIRLVNPEATDAAGEKAAALRERFSEWVWEDPERASRLTRAYNVAFNSTVLRSYTGEHLTFPGLAVSFQPHPHQRSAVDRMVSEPAVGLFHQVGAGKTAEMVMGVSELRRLGLVRKPAIVVPNHMLEQFGREYLQLYPQANLLTAGGTEDLAREKRREFVARVATGDWDCIVMTRGAFASLPVSMDTPTGLPRCTADQPAREPDPAVLQREPQHDQTDRNPAAQRRGTHQEDPRPAPRRRDHLRADRHRLPVHRRAARLQEPGHRLGNPQRRWGGFPAGDRPGDEIAPPAVHLRRTSTHRRYSHPDR